MRNIEDYFTEEDKQPTNNSRWERAHTIPKRRGGTVTVRVPIERHAEMHLDDANNRKADKAERKMDRDTVKSIVRRMRPEELNRFNLNLVRRLLGDGK